jgi:bisphosphoglycerate-dependent phosphoglycerate mutase
MKFLFYRLTMRKKFSMLVTAKSWYMKRRVYGKVVGGNKNYVFVKGKFGLEQFHRSSIRVVKGAKLCK